MVLGGWGVEGALDSVQVFGFMTRDGDGDFQDNDYDDDDDYSVQVLDFASGRWEDGPSLPSPR